jgi:hypothetical protein
VIEVEGKIDNQPITILIDSRSIHSYINSNIVEIFHLQRSKHKKSWSVQLVIGAKRKISELVKDTIPSIEYYLVLRDFKYFFGEILGLPAKRGNDFTIDLVPRSARVSMTPYKMDTPELKES